MAEQTHRTPQDATSMVAQLLDLLRREFQAIRQQNGAAIEQMAAEKSALVAQLNNLPKPSASAEFDADLRALLVACRQQNRVNGGAITQLRNHTQRLLGLLQGRSAGDSIYGHTGQSISLPSTCA